VPDEARTLRRTAQPGPARRVRPLDVDGSSSTQDRDYLFLINHTDRPAHVAVAPDATELLTGKSAPGAVSVPAGETAVVREPR
jgi:hypothetical protein